MWGDTGVPENLIEGDRESMFGLYVFTGLLAVGLLIGVLRRRRSDRSNVTNIFQRSSLDKK